MTRVALVLLGMLLARPAWAVTLEARLDPYQVRVGESADLSVTAQGAQDLPAPQIAAPDGVNLRYVGPETQVSLTNGHMTASITHHFSVAPTRAGAFTIGPITVPYQGATLTAGPVTLQALAANAPAAAGGGLAGDQLKLVLSTPRTEVFLHEALPLTIQLRVGNVQVTDLQYPTLPGEGFALEKLGEPSQQQQQTAQGAIQVVTFHSTLTPLKAGPLTLGPAHMGMGLVTRRRSRSPFGFFGDDLRSQPLDLQSDPLTLTVLPLPEEGRPAGFTGAVGQFDFDLAAAPKEVAVGDPITVTLTVRGTGNIESVTPPVYVESDALKVYPVQPQSKTGDRVFEQVVIPQHAGEAALPALSFSWFDPAARAYRTVTRGPVPITVRPAATAQAAPRIVGTRPEEPKAAETLGRDIVFIKDASGPFTPIGDRAWRHWSFWAWQWVPLAGWIAAIVYERRRRRVSGNVRYARFTRAGREAQRALAGARTALKAGDPAAFYDQVARAVSEYLAAKLDLPPGSVTAETARARLAAHGLAPTLAEELEQFFATCERVRFAPTALGDGDMPRTLERATAIVRALERARGLTAPTAALLLAALLTAAAHAAAPEGAATVFFRGNALYGEERYADAIAEYEKVLAGGQESGNLYFNLGNAYLRTGDVGRAVLAYERARRLIPGDPDLRANLAFARTLSGDTDEPPLWVRALFPLADRLTASALLADASALFAVVMFLLTVTHLFVGARWARPAAVVAAVGLVVLLASGVYRLATLELPAHAVVVAKQPATVRFEPSPNGTSHFEAKPGAVLRLLGEREGWAQVARADGRRGWIPRDTVAPL